MVPLRSKADCPANLQLCDKAITAAQDLVFEQGKQLVNYQNKSALQDQIIQDQQKRLDSPLNNKVYVIGGTVVIVLVAEILLGTFRK